MTTAEELLCSRRWRLTRSLWMLFGWFPFAFTAWIGYMIIGVKSKNWKWIAISIAFFVFGTAVFSVMMWVAGETNVQKGEPFPQPYATYSSIAMWSSLIVWLGNAAGLQWWINRKWLVWRANNDKKVSAPWYATATASGQPASHHDPQRVAMLFDTTLANGSGSSVPGPIQPPPPAPRAPVAQPAPVHQPPAWPQPAPATPAGAVSAPAAFVAPSAATVPPVLDINTATQNELASLPGFDASIAAQIVAVRNQTGGFGDTSELVTRAGVRPHLLTGLSGRIVVSSASGPFPPHASAESTPAPQHGRRLEF